MCITFFSYRYLFFTHQLVSLGDIAAVYTIYAALSLQFLQLGKYYPELMNCISFAERIFSFLDEKEECTEMVMTYKLIALMNLVN